MQMKHEDTPVSAKLFCVRCMLLTYMTQTDITDVNSNMKCDTCGNVQPRRSTSDTPNKRASDRFYYHP